MFESLKKLLASYHGEIPIYLHLDTPTKSRIQLVVGQGFYVAPCEKLIQDISDLLGEDRLSLAI